jgi:hypothetical protein
MRSTSQYFQAGPALTQFLYDSFILSAKTGSGVRDLGVFKANAGWAVNAQGIDRRRTFMIAGRIAVVALVGLILAGCGSTDYTAAGGAAMLAGPEDVRNGSLNPRIVSGSKRLECVPYARWRSKITIRGDAWTWWDTARNKYRRGTRPAVGSVLVLKRKGRGGRGHLAVVTRVLNDREIVVDHANWLNRGRIHKDTAVRDVSAANDWSAIKVWYTPGRQYGRTTYYPRGFIYPMRYGQSADARQRRRN